MVDVGLEPTTQKTHGPADDAILLDYCAEAQNVP